MKNECIYNTLDCGCRKIFVTCPRFIFDVTELGCGGACVEFDKKDKEVSSNENESKTKEK